MSVLDLVTGQEDFDSAFDGAIKKYLHGIEGGVVLNMAGFPDSHIYKGHGVILDGAEYKPQPVDGSQDALLVGVVRSNTKKTANNQASVGVMTVGVINNGACKYTFNAASLAKLKLEGIRNQVD